MRLAKQRRCSLDECLKTTTNREFLIWLAWWKLEKEREAKEITKQEYYFAEMIAAVKNVLCTKKDKLVKSKDCILTFDVEERERDTPNEPTYDELAATKAAWFARTGYRGPR